MEKRTRKVTFEFFVDDGREGDWQAGTLEDLRDLSVDMDREIWTLIQEVLDVARES